MPNGPAKQRVYHVWFATKRRKWLLDGQIEARIKALLAETAARHDIDLLASEAMIDHVHLLVRLTRRQDLSKCMNLLKGVTARRIFKEMPDLKFDAQMSHFWQRRFGSKLVPPEAVPAVQRYIETQKERSEKYER